MNVPPSKTAGVLLVAAALYTSPVMAQEVVRINESALNKLADAVRPHMKLSGEYSFLCTDTWTAEVTALSFDISPIRILVNGSIEGSWCGFDFSAPIAASANVRLNSDRRALLVTVEPTSVRPRVSYHGIGITLPMAVDVGETLSLDPIPISTTLLHFETARGAQSLRLRPLPESVSVVKRDGHILLLAAVDLF